MTAKPTCSGLWQGIVPPQHIYANRRFRCIALEPPNLDPGSWIGAGKAIFDHQETRFVLTARPRKAEGNVRGFAANIYQSKDGESFELVTSIGKQAVAEISGLAIHSIEGTQLLKDPLSGEWHIYISVDTGSDFVWGGLYWETLLLTAPSLEGPWEPKGLVLKNDQAYDANQARDATIDIVDGKWFCLYKAINKDRQERPALATSSDGVEWNKHGPLTIEGTDQLAVLSGTIFAGTNGPLFMGLERYLTDSRTVTADMAYADQHRVGHGGGPIPRFVAYNIDYRNMNLERIFYREWEPLSEFEHPKHPLLGYASLVYDPLRNRMLSYVEAIDPVLTKQIGLNETVERLLLYETPL